MSGNFDSVRKEFAEPDSLWSTVMQPNDVWDSQYAQAAKEMASGLPPLAAASLSKAVTFARGVIPKDQWNSSVLGELAPRAIAAEPAKPVQNGIKTQSPQTSGVPRTKGESRRPSRFPKRKYDDTSYKGYGEGYIDDDLGESGYSTGDGERTARKRPKKVCASLLIYQNITWLTSNQRLDGRTASKVRLRGRTAMVLEWSEFDEGGSSVERGTHGSLA